MRHAVHEDFIELRGEGKDVAVALGKGPWVQKPGGFDVFHMVTFGDVWNGWVNC